MPSTTPCVPCCPTPQVVNVPGIEGAQGNAGADGTNGTNGTNGENAFTTTTGFTVPNNPGDAVTIPVAQSNWCVVGQEIVVDGPAHFLVTSVPTTTSIVTTWSAYQGDVAGGTVIANGKKVGPSGKTPTFKTVKVLNIYQGTTTYTPTLGLSALYVECIGAGGAGGGGQTGVGASLGAGGGGGGYSTKYLTSLKASYTVAVGAAGVPGVAGNNAGGDGGDTTFDSPSVCTAKGGAGGAGGGAHASTDLIVGGGQGGVQGSGLGDWVLGGTDGGASLRLSATAGISGAGAPGPLGGGGASGTTTQGAGKDAEGSGAGGSGGATLNGGADTQGGTGADGMIRVWELG